MTKIKRNVGGEDVMISDNLNTFYDLNKDVREFIYPVIEKLPEMRKLIREIDYPIGG